MASHIKLTHHSTFTQASTIITHNILFFLISGSLISGWISVRSLDTIVPIYLHDRCKVFFQHHVEVGELTCSFGFTNLFTIYITPGWARFSLRFNGHFPGEPGLAGVY